MIRIDFPDEAEVLEHRKLPVDQVAALFDGYTYDPLRHTIYQIPIIIRDPIAASKRKSNKFGIHQADRLVVQITTRSPHMRIKGVFPTSMVTNKDPGEYELEVSSELAKTTFRAALRRKIQGSREALITERMARFAQWAFYQPWFATGQGFDVRFVCEFESAATVNDRTVVTKVRVNKGLRNLTPGKQLGERKHVYLPVR